MQQILAQSDSIVDTAITDTAPGTLHQHYRTPSTKN